MTGQCSVAACDRTISYRGLCSAHAERRRTGSPLDSPVRAYRVDFEALVDKTGACWIWQGCVNSYGYGYHSGGYAHRLMYERHVGPIPDGLQIDHLCRVRNCVNPDHLEAVTQRENILRSEAPNAVAVRTNKCSRGHEFTPENTFGRRNGGRSCRACRRLRDGSAA